MWTTVKIVSDAIDKSMDDASKHHLMRSVYGGMSGGHYNEHFAKEDVAKMYYTDANGEVHHAPYWTEGQVEAVYESVRSSFPKEYNMWDFYVALNMEKSDKCPLYKKWFPNATPEDMDKKFIESAINWLNDPDNPYGNSKVWGYMNHA